MNLLFLCRAGLLPLTVALPAMAQMSVRDDMADLSIEELANIQITSVSKKAEPLGGAAASVFVITNDDIRRSGAVSLPEALRLAPNLQVAARSGYEYSITARGLNGSANSVPNKLLVMIDGRSVYAPLFSGVPWDVQNVMLDDVERIEVISGPGGTLWGVNAVNGVINIITRAASASAGQLVSLHAGQRGAMAAFRHGGTSANGHWRVFGGYLDERHTRLETGARVNDSRRQSHLGFRSDWRVGDARFSVHGNAYRGRAEQPEPGAISVTGTTLVLGDVSTSGVNLTGAWNHSLADGASLSLQAYLDRSKRTVVPTLVEALDIADLQFQHTLSRGGAHQLVWGASARYTWDDVINSEVIAFLPAKFNQTWLSVFAQDDIALRENLRMTVGARVERNDYTGAEFLPSARLAWQVTPQHALWSGLSRTVRAPSRLDADTFIPGAPPYVLRGGPQVRAEVAKVAELGYRGQPAPGLSFSATLFYNRYDHFRTTEVDSSFTFVTFGSQMHGSARGLEMWGSFQAASNWRISAGWMGLRQHLELKPGSLDEAAPLAAGRDPKYTAQLRSTWSMSDDVELELAARRVGALVAYDLPAYSALDARLGWRVRRDLELSVSGQNLNGGHAEYGPLATRTVVPRALAVKLVWTI